MATWLEALFDVEVGVHAALQEARIECEKAEGALDAANPADSEDWHRLAWLRYVPRHRP